MRKVNCKLAAGENFHKWCTKSPKSSLQGDFTVSLWKNFPWDKKRGGVCLPGQRGGGVFFLEGGGADFDQKGGYPPLVHLCSQTQKLNLNLKASHDQRQHHQCQKCFAPTQKESGILISKLTRSACCRFLKTTSMLKFDCLSFWRCFLSGLWNICIKSCENVCSLFSYGWQVPTWV